MNGNPEFQNFAFEMRKLLELISLYQGEWRYYENELPLFPAEVHLMCHIEEGIDGITELANHERKSKSAISQIVSRIQKKGLLEKCPSSTNKRELILKLTEQGKQITQYHRKIDEKLYTELWERMGSLSNQQRLDTVLLFLHALQDCYEERL